MDQTVQNTNTTSCVCSFSWGEATRTVHWIEVVAFLPAKQELEPWTTRNTWSSIVFEDILGVFFADAKITGTAACFSRPVTSKKASSYLKGFPNLVAGQRKTVTRSKNMKTTSSILRFFHSVHGVLHFVGSGRPIWRLMLNACGFGPKVWITKVRGLGAWSFHAPMAYPLHPFGWRYSTMFNLLFTLLLQQWFDLGFPERFFCTEFGTDFFVCFL